MIDQLFQKIYDEVIRKEPMRSFFVKELFKETWVDWELLENKLNDFYHLGVDKVELINRKREKYHPELHTVAWSNRKVIDVEEIFDAVEKNHSMVLLGASRMHPNINEICRAIEKQVPNAAVDVHVYCGTKKSRSFNIHCDHADNFIIQQTGRSHWKVYKEYSLDMNQLRNLENDKKLSLDFECTLRPGDMIYVPKHRFHYAEPLEKRISLSFAVSDGIQPIKRKWYKFK